MNDYPEGCKFKTSSKVGKKSKWGDPETVDFAGEVSGVADPCPPSVAPLKQRSGLRGCDGGSHNHSPAWQHIHAHRAAFASAKMPLLRQSP
jgi:hypothetical protein